MKFQPHYRLYKKDKELESYKNYIYMKYGYNSEIYKSFRKKRELILLSFSPSIIPDKYVWHLSSPSNREKILKNGIIPNNEEHAVVFVNNQIENPLLLWPIAYDDSSYYFDRHQSSEKNDLFFAFDEKLSNYDYWRIDTLIAGKDEYKIDPNDPAFMFSDFNSEKGRFGARPDYYLCRKNVIHPSALKLFRYKPNTYHKYNRFLAHKEPLEYQCQDGVISIKGFNKAYPYYLEELKCA